MSKMSKLMISILNKLEIYSSYDEIIMLIKVIIKIAHDYFNWIYFHDQIIWIFFDNLIYVTNIKLQILFNQNDFIIIIIRYLIISLEFHTQ